MQILGLRYRACHATPPHHFSILIPYGSTVDMWRMLLHARSGEAFIHQQTEKAASRSRFAVDANLCRRIKSGQVLTGVVAKSAMRCYVFRTQAQPLTTASRNGRKLGELSEADESD